MKSLFEQMIGVKVPCEYAWDDGGIVRIGAKQLTDSIGTVEDPKRRRELQDLKRAIDLRKQLEKENR